MEGVNWVEIAGICSGMGVVLVPIAKYIIKDYVAKTKELEKKKEDDRAHELRSIKDMLKSCEKEVKDLSQKLTVVDKSFAVATVKLTENGAYQEKLVKAIGQTFAMIDSRMKSLEGKIDAIDFPDGVELIKVLDQQLGQVVLRIENKFGVDIGKVAVVAQKFGDIDLVHLKEDLYLIRKKK